MKLLWLTHRRDTPSTRYRVHAFTPKLEAAGHVVRALEYPSHPLKIYSMLKLVAEADVVAIQKRLPPRWLTRTIRRLAKRLVFDFDDAIYLKKTEDGLLHRGAREVRFRAMVQAADVVLCGNAHLGRVELIQDGYNGFLVRGREEWRSRLAELVVDTAKRRTFGERGRSWVIGRYSLPDVACPALCNECFIAKLHAFSLRIDSGVKTPETTDGHGFHGLGLSKSLNGNTSFNPFRVIREIRGCFGLFTRESGLQSSTTIVPPGSKTAKPL